MAHSFDKEIKASMKESKKTPGANEMRDPKTGKIVDDWSFLQPTFDEYERKKKEKFDNNPIVKGTRKAKDTVSSFIDRITGDVLDTPRDSITDDRYPGKKLSIRELGTGIKEGYTNYKDMVKGTGKFEKNTKSGDK